MVVNIFLKSFFAFFVFKQRIIKKLYLGFFNYQLFKSLKQ